MVIESTPEIRATLEVDELCGGEEWVVVACVDGSSVYLHERGLGDRMESTSTLGQWKYESRKAAQAALDSAPAIRTTHLRESKNRHKQQRDLISKFRRVG